MTYGLLPATVLVQDLRAKRASWAPHQGEFWRAVPVSRQAPRLARAGSEGTQALRSALLGASTA